MSLITKFFTEFQESPVNLLTLYGLILYGGYIGCCRLKKGLYDCLQAVVRTMIPLLVIIGLMPSSCRRMSLGWLMYSLKQGYTVIVYPLSHLLVDLASKATPSHPGSNLPPTQTVSTSSASMLTPHQEFLVYAAIVPGLVGASIGVMLVLGLVGLKYAAKYTGLKLVPYW